MKRQQHLVLVTLALVAAFLLLAGPVAARATKTEFTATVWEMERGDPEREWFTKNGDILHKRGQPCSRPITGDIEGTMSAINNLNLDVVTG